MFLEKTKKILLLVGVSLVLVFSFGTFNSDNASAWGSSSPTVCGLNDIGWLVCPILRSAAKGGDFAFAFISNSLLQFESGILNNGGGGGASIAKNAWNMTVSVANVLLVISLIFIAYNYVSGRSVSSGYALKKMMPRLLVVAIMINTSYIICLVLIDISNILGYSVLNLTKNLLDASGANPGMSLQINPDISASVGGVGSSDFNVLTNITSNVLANPNLAWVIAVPLAVIVLSILLICAIMIVVLIFRKILIVTMVLLAPIAFALYLLPNTEKFFNQWKKLTLSALLLYPIIALLLASGQIVSSAIYSRATDTSSTLKSGGYGVNGDVVDSTSQTTGLIAAAAAVLPLLATWYVFKLSMSGIDMASVRVKKGYSKKSGSKSAERRREITAKLGGSSNIMSNIQKVQQALQNSDSGSFNGSRRTRKKDNQSQEQSDFDIAVNARLQEIKADKNGPTPQVRYAKALKRFQDENEGVSMSSSRSGAMNINNASAVELKAAEAYLLDSMGSGSLSGSSDFKPRINSNNSLDKFNPSNQKSIFNNNQSVTQNDGDSQGQNSLPDNKLSLGGILSPNGGSSNVSNGTMKSDSPQSSASISQAGDVNVENAIINMNGNSSDNKNVEKSNNNNNNGPIPSGKSSKRGVLENSLDNRNLNPTTELERKAKARAAKYVNAAHQTENDDLFNSESANTQDVNLDNGGKVFDIKQNNKKG